MFTIVQRRKVYFLLSGVLIGAGLIAMIASWITTGSPFRVGVDFRSGTRFEVVFLEAATEDAIRQSSTNSTSVTRPSFLMKETVDKAPGRFAPSL